jgi:hypothetical protein
MKLLNISSVFCPDTPFSTMSSNTLILFYSRISDKVLHRNKEISSWILLTGVWGCGLGSSCLGQNTLDRPLRP